MKTSNKLLTVITAIILTYLVIFDMGLKAEYLKGEFRSRFYSMKQLSYKDFNKVNYNAADIMSIRVERGASYAVWIEKSLEDRFIITKNNHTLNINYDSKKGRLWGGEQPHMIIICPSLDSLTTTAFHTDKDKMVSNYGTSTTVAGFDQTKLGVLVNSFTKVNLVESKLGTFYANVGDKTHGQAGLSINAGNQIKTANIKVPGRSELNLVYPKIDKMNYAFSDSAMVTLNGSSLTLLNK